MNLDENTEKPLDSKKVLEKASELIETNQSKIDKLDIQEGSYDDESKKIEDAGNQTIEVMDGPKSSNHSKRFKVSKIGYKRYPAYKKPAIYKFVLGVAIIIGLIYVVSLMLPYVAPGS